MLRRMLAVFLVLSWFGLAGVDLIEDLDLPFKTEFEGSSEIPGPGAKRVGLAHNIVEFANSPRIARSKFCQPSSTRSNHDRFADSLTRTKLHKYHQILLI